MNPGPFRRKAATTVSLFCIAALAVAVRCLPWRNFTGAAGEYLFYGPDSYDHLRRITLGMETFPRIPAFDSYYGFPAGTGQIWAPLFDYLLSAVSLLAGRAGEGHAAAHTIGFWLPPLLAGATIFLMYAVGERMFGRAAGLAAAVVLAVLPGNILYTFVSELDHHAAEPALLLLILASLARGDKDSGGRSWLRAGIALVAAVLLWRGSVVFWGIAFAALLLQAAVESARRDTESKTARLGSRAFLSAAVVLAVIVAFNVWGSTNRLSFQTISWFHVIALLAAAGIFVFVERTAGLRRLVWPSVSAVLATLVLFAFAPARRFLHELAGGILVIGGNDPWLNSISELRPMLFPGGTFEPGHALETLSLLYPALPVLGIVALLRWRRGGYRDFRLCLFGVTSVALFLLPLFRERFVHIAALGVALGAGFGITLIKESLNERRAALFGPIALLLCLAPVAPFLTRIPSVGLPAHERYDLMQTLQWIAERTPATSGYMHPASPPEYGILSDWGLGAYVTYIGERPTLATNFGWETHGLFESAEFLTTSDPASAAALLENNRIRYILLNNVGGNLATLRSIADYGVHERDRLGRQRPPFAPLQSMFIRLYVQDGAAYAAEGRDIRALGTYRLLYESPGGFNDPSAGFISHYKLFERVAGAVVSGTASPGTPLEVEINLKSPSGRIMTYRDATTSSSSGAFAFRVPYASNAPSGDFVPAGPYLVRTARHTMTFSVTEDDVSKGRTVTAGQPPKAGR